MPHLLQTCGLKLGSNRVRTDGTEFDANIYSEGIYFESPVLFKTLKLSLNYDVSQGDYLNPSVFSDTGQRRKNMIQTLTFSASTDVSGIGALNFSYVFTNSDSNISNFGFTQGFLTVGISEDLF